MKATGMGETYVGEIKEVTTWRWQRELIDQGYIMMLDTEDVADIAECAECGRMWGSESRRDDCDHGVKAAADAAKRTT